MRTSRLLQGSVAGTGGSDQLLSSVWCRADAEGTVKRGSAATNRQQRTTHANLLMRSMPLQTRRGAPVARPVHQSFILSSSLVFSAPALSSLPLSSPA